MGKAGTPELPVIGRAGESEHTVLLQYHRYKDSSLVATPPILWSLVEV
jgi:hypothetical protein